MNLEISPQTTIEPIVNAVDYKSQHPQSSLYPELRTQFLNNAFVYKGVLVVQLFHKFKSIRVSLWKLKAHFCQ